MSSAVLYAWAVMAALFLAVLLLLFVAGFFID